MTATFAFIGQAVIDWIVPAVWITLAVRWLVARRRQGGWI